MPAAYISTMLPPSRVISRHCWSSSGSFCSIRPRCQVPVRFAFLIESPYIKQVMHFLPPDARRVRSCIFEVPGTIEPADSWLPARLSESPGFRVRVVDAASVLHTRRRAPTQASDGLPRRTPRVHSGLRRSECDPGMRIKWNSMITLCRFSTPPDATAWSPAESVARRLLEREDRQSWLV
jgi:hypothetical protein